MAIVAKCKCGNKVKAKDEFAGKKVRCDACKGVVRMPALESNPVADLLEEIGYVTATKNSCPECKSNLTPEAVLCVACGYHLEKRRRLSTKRI